MWPTVETAFRNGFLQLQVEALQRCGISCDVLVQPTNARGVRGYLRTMLAVRRAVSARSYDLVHGHYGLTAAACLGLPLPLVVTFHGSDIYGAVRSGRRNSLRSGTERLVSKLVSHRADAVIAVSSRMAATLSHVDPAVIPVGIDTTLFQPMPQSDARRQLGLDPNKPYVLFAANPDNPVKRYSLAVEAISLAARHVPDITLLTVSGEPLARMPLWMNAADALIITSAFEGGPMVHREAMSCNLPVVSVDVGDVARHLCHVSHSQIVRDEPLALAHALERILAARSRSNGREFADATDTKASAEAITRVYLRIIDTPPYAA